MWLGVDIRHMCKRDWTTCSKYAKHSRFDNQTNRGKCCDHLMSIRIFTLIWKQNEIDFGIQDAKRLMGLKVHHDAVKPTNSP